MDHNSGILGCCCSQFNSSLQYTTSAVRVSRNGTMCKKSNKDKGSTNLPWSTNETSAGPLSRRGAATSNISAGNMYTWRLFLGCLGCLANTRSPTRAGAAGIRRSNSEQSSDLVGPRVVWKEKRRAKLGIRQPCKFFRRHGFSTL